MEATLNEVLEAPETIRGKRALLRLVAAMAGEAIPVRAVRALAVDVHPEEFQTVVDALVAERLLISDGDALRLAAHLVPSARQMLRRFKKEISGLIEWFIESVSKDGDESIDVNGMQILWSLTERTCQLGLYHQLFSLVRVAEVRWIRHGQWDFWQRALTLHLEAAKAVDNLVEHAWAQHQLALLSACRGDVDQALHLLEKTRRLQRDTGEIEGAALTDDNIKALRQSKQRQRGGRALYILLGLLTGGVLLLMLFGWSWMTAASSAPRRAEPSQDLASAVASEPVLSPLYVTPGRTVRFGETPLDDTRTQIITVYNSGQKPLSVKKLVLSEDSELKHFSLSANNCNKAMPPHRACFLEVFFNPKTPGDKFASLRIHSDAAAEGLTLKISGIGR
jgi:hypothetical protein